ncbi:Uncharacterised protein [Legionella pneumophila]|nr:Uncharacterised protein [Legionella pneumophila]
MSKTYTEKLFSYGTLRYEKVQIANFGRKMQGQEDVLQGFKLTTIEIKTQPLLRQVAIIFIPLFLIRTIPQTKFQVSYLLSAKKN